MFSVIVKGRSLEDLRKNLIAFTSEFDDGIRVHQNVDSIIAKEADRIMNAQPFPVTGETHKVSISDTLPMRHSPADVAAEASEVEYRADEKAGVYGPERDARGLPWDERIHASSKSFNKDGTWRTRRGVEQARIDQVEAVLRNRRFITNQPVALPPVPQTPVQQSLPLPPVAPTAQEVLQQAPPRSFEPIVVPAIPQTAPSAPQPVGVAPVVQPVIQSYDPIQVPPTAQKPAHSLETFKANIFVALTSLVATGALTPDYIQTLKGYFNVKEIWDVKDNPAQVEEMFNTFCKAGLITKVG